MTRKKLNDLYFEWLYELVDDGRCSEEQSYRELFMHLHETEFIYSLPMDSNRYEDGIDLRYRFCRELGLDSRMTAAYLDDKPCSVLEMMVALAVKCEEHITYNPDIGDRTGKWFWTMIESIGLDTMDDDHFDREKTAECMDICLNHRYCRNGKGGFFTIQKCSYDLRTIDIWRQMCWYIEQFYKNERRTKNGQTGV